MLLIMLVKADTNPNFVRVSLNVIFEIGFIYCKMKKEEKGKEKVKKKKKKAKVYH